MSIYNVLYNFRYDVIKNVYKPNADFKFPAHEVYVTQYGKTEHNAPNFELHFS